MALILVTGSTDGLGRAAARSLLADGHQVVVHARNRSRLAAVRDLLAAGALSVVGDLADDRQTRDLATQVDRLGTMDAVIHNAGVLNGPAVLPVNVVAPYLLTALMRPAKRLIYLSSGMHRGGRADLGGVDWGGRRRAGSYSGSKLFVTALAFAVAGLRPDSFVNAVDPGWVPTRMGGPEAPDDLELGYVTQAWLATSRDPLATTTAGYWHHQARVTPHPAVRDAAFQQRLVESLAHFTGVTLA